MKNSLIKLASSSLVALLLTGCYGITITQKGNVALIGNEGNDNVSAQISGHY